MPIDYEAFRVARGHHVELGEAERREYGRRLATDAKHDIENFDPRDVLALGAAGVAEFVATILPAKAKNAVEAEEGVDPERSAPPQNWESSRIAEGRFEIAAIGWGLTVGALGLAGYVITHL